MIKQKSKIFLLITALITFVMLVSFGALYFVLPDFYLYTKNKKLESQSQVLAESLKQADSYEACTSLMRDFSLHNNSNVIPYDQTGRVILSLFSPLMMLSVNSQFDLTITEGPRRETVKVQSIPSSNTSRQGIIRIQESPSSNLGFFIAGRNTSVALPGQALQMTKTTANASFIRVDVQSEMISYIEVMSTFQPIDEAKSVLLNLMPFLLAVDILIALVAAYLYLRKVDQYERDKVGFMRAASHELKTPVAALGGILEGMIDHVGVYKDTDKYLMESKGLVDRLSVLINEILNASQNPKLVIEDVSVREAIDEALACHKLFIEEKELSVVVEAMPESSEGTLDFTCRTDKRLFFMVVSNLISNAVRYTKPNGTVRLHVAQDQVFSIENECEPIDTGDLEKLFEPFYTLDDSRNRSQSGTGLGLYIVRRSLDAMKMKYKIENTSLGIKFNIFFPGAVKK